MDKSKLRPEPVSASTLTRARRLIAIQAWERQNPLNRLNWAITQPTQRDASRALDREAIAIEGLIQPVGRINPICLA